MDQAPAADPTHATTRDGLPGSLLGLTRPGEHPAALAAARSRHAALGGLLIVHLVLEMGLWAHLAGDAGRPMAWLVGLLALSLGLYLTPRGRQPALWIAFPACLAVHALLFPNAANHMLLLLLSLGMLALFDPRHPAEAREAIAGLRWLTAIVLFSTGLQKLLYGSYFQAEFLSWQIAHADRFASFLQLLVSPEEIERLQRLGAGASDAGVYRSRDLALLLASNGAWLGELLLPFALIVRRTRPWAVGATLLLLLSVEAGAREIFFGVLFVNLVLSFTERDWNRPLLPISIALYLVSVASRAGWLPEWSLN